MSDSAIFEFAAGELEQITRLGRVAVRSALRAALAQALFEPARVSANQLRLVVERLLVPELRRAGVQDAEQACRQLAARIASEPFEASDPESPDEVFSRLIRR